MSVYISGMARRAGVPGGSGGSSTSNRGGAAGGRGGEEEKREAGHAVTLPGGPGALAVGGRGPAEEEAGERSGSSARPVYGAGGGASGWGLSGSVCRGVCVSVQELSYCLCLPCCCTVLLQHGADPNIRNTDGKSALDLAEPSAKAVLTGQSSATHTHAHTCTDFLQSLEESLSITFSEKLFIYFFIMRKRSIHESSSSPTFI